MFKEFEGRTEEEARNKAIEELGLQGGDFDVEILENIKKGLFDPVRRRPGLSAGNRL